MADDTPSHDEGEQAPFPPAWPGDIWPGHHKSCGVRVKTNCTCGMAEFEAQQNVQEASAGRRAELPIAFEYIHQLLNLPDDVHIVGAHAELYDQADFGNIIFEIEAFADNTFPGTRVTAHFRSQWDVRNGVQKVIFDGWELVE